ncbi:DMT family transporter [Rhodovulum sp. DZ06]|uniref:DMT family transporter n=1 Tax=Rhodovulum sp. DZ06 TaxID=3425126 RepID=UPI003D340895
MADTAAARQDRPLLGIGMTLMAFFTFSCLDSSAKWLALAGVPVIQIGFMRYAVHFAFSMGPRAAKGEGLSAFHCARPGLTALRGAMLMTSTICNFVAIQFIPLTLTATIMFLTPIIVTALSGPVLGEKVGPWRWGAVAAGFIGVLIAVRPFGAEFHWAVFVSLLGATAFAVYALLTRMLSGVVSPSVMQLYGGAVGTFALLPLAIWAWEAPTEPLQWVLMLAIGFFGWFGHGILTQAYSYAEASLLTPFAYVQIVFLGFWSWTVFDTAPDAWILMGAAIVIAAGLTIWTRERRQAKAARLRVLAAAMKKP